VQESEYGGLFDRPKHSGVLNFLYTIPDYGMTASLRGIFRSRYGYADVNGNLILDDDKEYAPGYVLWNFTISKDLLSMFTVQLGVDNIFNMISDKFLTLTPGRIFYLSLTYNFIQK
jgi:outer membrane receptor for ferrienterochelin and colicins